MKRINCINTIAILLSLCSCNKKNVKTDDYNYEVFFKKNVEVSEISIDSFKDDVLHFCHLIETSYAGYDKAKENGLNLNQVKNDIFFQAENYNDYISCRTGITLLYDYFKPYLNDYHANLEYEGDIFRFTQPEKFYFSNIYVKKNDDAYIILESDNDKLEPGSICSIDGTFLFYYPSKGENVYRIGMLSSDEKTDISLGFGEDVYSINIEKSESEENGFCYFTRETGKSVYIKCNRCFFENEREADALLRFSNSADLYRNKEYIILDVRGNPGGDNSYGNRFLASLYKRNPDSALKEINNAYSVWKYSPASVVSLKEMIRQYADLSEKGWKSIYKKLTRLEKKNMTNPVIITESQGKGVKFKDGEYKGKIIILTDSETCSSAEDFVITSKMLFGKTGRVIQIGQNTAGCVLYGNVCTYMLPNSGIAVTLPMTDFSYSAEITNNFHGEGKGFYPDLWSTEADLNDTIFYVTNDDELWAMLEDNIL